MPAMLDDPASPAIYRRSGEKPYPVPGSPLPTSIQPRTLVLRDRTTKASLIPFSSPAEVPLSLIDYLRQQLNREIEKGDTYPMIDPFTFEAFGPYWFSNFGAVMLLGEVNSADDVRRMEKEGCNWEKQCLGSFYVKPNYPGRSSHVCNGGFLVTDGARNRGVGRLMGECYLEWAPLLGYTYSVFNLVYETNVVSCRIWDSLGFKRIGRVPGCGNLATQPEGHFVDAIIFGRHLGYKKEDTDDEKRFERIKYYLKTGKYPGDADSAEKNRLRAAVRNYTLVEGGGDGAGGGAGGDKLMLGDKEVISEPRMQYEIARQYHRQNKDTHAGINKTTATVSEKYHWNRIKTTVTEVIENCAECNEKLKKKSLKSAAAAAAAAASSNNNGNNGGGGGQRKISGSVKPPIAISSSSSSPNEQMTASATPTPGPEFVFQHELSVGESTSATIPRASSSSAPALRYDMASDDMALDPHNIAMLSSAVQNLGNSGDTTPSYHSPHGFDPSYSSIGDPFGQSQTQPTSHHLRSGSLEATTSIDPATIQQQHQASPNATSPHPASQHLAGQAHHRQYLSPYQPLTGRPDHFGAQHPSSPDPTFSSAGMDQSLSQTEFVGQDGALLDGYASDTQQRHYGAS